MDVWLYLLFIPAGYITYLFHESGHWLVGELLGNEMVFTLNGVWPAAGHYLDSSHALYVYLGGPVCTILQSVIVLLVIGWSGSMYAYPFVFFPVFTRFFSLLLGGFDKQDEAKIAALLDVGPYTIALIVLFVLLVILLWSGYKLRIGLKYYGYFMAVSPACLLMVIQTDKLI